MTHSKPTVHHCLLATSHRRLAFSQVGSADSARVLLCLPGLLETRATFDALLQAAENLHGLRVISIDHCGRGDSDRLPGDKGYCMSVYLEDIVQFLRQEVMRPGQPVPQIDVLGTSMGGILAMYLAQDKNNHVAGLFFNDIGLNLNWLSIYGLSDGLKVEGRLPEPAELAVTLNVSIGAVMAVSSPAHFDLPYRKDWKGMQFGHLLKAKGLAVSLLTIRHLLTPLIAWGLARFFELDNTQTSVLLAFSALPTASSCYVLAARMGYNGAFVAGLVTLSTLLGMLSLPFALGVLR